MYSPLCKNRQELMKQSTYNNPGSLINKIARLNARWLEPRLQPFGLAVAQMPVFTILQKGPASQRELAQQLQVEQPTMAQLLQRMERDGLITRTPDPEDGRSSLVELTSVALRKAEPAQRILEEGRKELLRDLGKDDLNALNELLSKLLRNLELALLK